MEQPFGAPAGLLHRLTRAQVRTGDLIAAVEDVRATLDAPGLELAVVDGPVLVVEEGGRRTRVPLVELAGEMSRARVLPTPEGVTAALRSWLARRPVPDVVARKAGIAVLDWADTRQSVLGWRVVVAREGTIVTWRPSRTATLPAVHQVRSAALGRASVLPGELHLAGPVALWSHPDMPGLDTALLTRPEDLLAESASAGLSLPDAHVVVTPRRPVACAEPGVARRLAAEATEASRTMPWRDLADLGWA
ncbi:hypothetical protein SAMN05661080_01573 [Modestobacter sp. DSM 44400]|uniref:hypothetical protein n=1 Tax=Modestobacter sp. DSM 44400 TaxID=1550230 RepID=UPI0008981F98|nr:hypothetical protein [Modestobacter sp. DSM 44400]SDX88108.1 hypothetical protein SAMN05661080_01573 [Modestobacter sp. DSM 44400]